MSIDKLVDAIVAANPCDETHSKKVAWGWCTPDGVETSWDWHQQNAKWPIQEGYRIKYYTTATARTLK
jgi:hypothetical protein